MYKTTQDTIMHAGSSTSTFCVFREMYIVCFRTKLIFIIIVLYSVFTEQYISCPWTRPWKFRYNVVVLWMQQLLLSVDVIWCIGISTPKSTQNVVLSLFVMYYLFIYHLPLYMHAVEKFSVYVYVYCILSFYGSQTKDTKI